MGKLVCNVCKVYHTEILTDLMKHIRLFHSHKPNFSIKCGIGYGPLVRHWTMRYAAKHSYFKHLAQSMGNFINIEFSLATRHQLLQCYLHTDKTTIQGSKFVVGPGKYYACCGMICMLCSSVLHGVMILWMRVIPPPSVKLLALRD